MKSNLLKLFAIAAFTLQLVGFVSAQTDKKKEKKDAPKPIVTVKQNGEIKIRQIDLFFKMSSTDESVKFDFEPAANNYLIPANIEALKYEIELMNPAIQTIKARLEVRQVCTVKDTPDLGVAQELEIVATETEQRDETITKKDGKFEVIINVHNPKELLVHEFEHCFGDPDHLGEGPHQTFFSLRSAGSSVGANETPHVVYTRGFRTTRKDIFDRARALEFVNRASKKPNPDEKPKQH